jgi:hypothetical protein
MMKRLVRTGRSFMAADEVGEVEVVEVEVKTGLEKPKDVEEDLKLL